MRVSIRYRKIKPDHARAISKLAHINTQDYYRHKLCYTHRIYSGERP